MAHKQCVVDCDVDHTSCNTSKLHLVLSETVPMFNRSIVPAKFKAEMHDFYFGCGYEIRAHLMHYSLNFDELRPGLISSFAATNFIYDDALAAIDQFLNLRTTMDFRWMTMGECETQNFKIEVMLNEIRRRRRQQIAPIPAEVISIDKGSHLNALWSNGICHDQNTYDLGILIDDNAAQLAKINIRPDMKVYNIYRPGAKYLPSPRQDLVHINDMRDIAA